MKQSFGPIDNRGSGWLIGDDDDSCHSEDH